MSIAQKIMFFIFISGQTGKHYVNIEMFITEKFDTDPLVTKKVIEDKSLWLLHVT